MSKKKYDSGEIYRFLKGNNWVLDTTPANNLGDYQTTLRYVNRSGQHVQNNLYGPTLITNLKRRIQANMLGYIEEHKKIERDINSVWYVNAREHLKMKSNALKDKNNPPVNTYIGKRFPVTISQNDDFDSFIEKVCDNWATREEDLKKEGISYSCFLQEMRRREIRGTTER